MFRDKFRLSLALTIPVVFWSTDVQRWLGYTAPSFPGSKFIPAILGTVVFVYGGLVFIRGAWGELADRKPGMIVPRLQGSVESSCVWARFRHSGNNHVRPNSLLARPRNK
jgi:cation transport ATPase